MKRIYLIGCILLACLGCSTEKTPENIIIDKKPHRLNVVDKSISLGAKTDLTKSLKIEADNTGWTISGIPSTNWLTVSPISGKTTTDVEVAAQPNQSADSTRTAILNVSSSESNYSFSKNVEVTQSALPVEVKPQETSFSCSATATTKTIAVDANVDWTAECAETWVTLIQNGNTLNITVAENLSMSRTATVSLKRAGTANVLSTISIVQSEANVTGSTETMTFSVDGETKTAQIVAEASWTTYVSEASWISVSPESGSHGDIKLSITTTPNGSSNSRDGFVYIKIGEATKLSIPIHQEALSIKIEGTATAIDSDGGNPLTLTVNANTAWSVLSCPDWLTVSPQNGAKGLTAITLTAEANNSVNARNGKLRIGKEGTSIYDEAQIEQVGKIMDGSTIEFQWSASSQTIHVSVPNSWSAMKSVDWMTLSQYAGTGETDITVGVETNDSEDERTGSISIVTEGKMFNVNVLQHGQYLKIGETSGTVGVTGGTVIIDVNTTVGAKGSVQYGGSTQDWIAVDNSQPNRFVLTVAPNPSQYARTATFVIYPEQDATNQTCKSGVSYTITQDGRMLSANVQSIAFLYNGGSSDTFVITADGAYDISKASADTWYVVEHDAAARTFRVIASENSSDKRAGMITLSLKNLPTGESRMVEIPVIQYKKGASFGFNDFGDDENWDE